jgi:hypothetical protein
LTAHVVVNPIRTPSLLKKNLSISKYLYPFKRVSTSIRRNLFTKDDGNFTADLQNVSFMSLDESYGFFVLFRIFFSDNTKVRIFIFFVAQSANIFPEFNIRLYDKNSESDYFFFLHQYQNIFFSNIGNQNIFLEKNHNPPLQVKWSFP